jgi:hypothetical protein
LSIPHIQNEDKQGTKADEEILDVPGRNGKIYIYLQGAGTEY